MSKEFYGFDDPDFEVEEQPKITVEKLDVMQFGRVLHLRPKGRKTRKRTIDEQEARGEIGEKS